MHPLVVDVNARTIRPQFAEGDDFYGLAKGTNCTAAECRRACAMSCLIPLNGCSPDQLSWVRSNGHRAVGLDLMPPRGEPEFANPWLGAL